jgi:hypothetical protein
MESLVRPSSVQKTRVPQMVTASLLAAACLMAVGCYRPATSSARRWLDPLGWTSKKDLSEEPEFQKKVSKDPFPTASQVGFSTTTKE